MQTFYDKDIMDICKTNDTKDVQIAIGLARHIGKKGGIKDPVLVTRSWMHEIINSIALECLQCVYTRGVGVDRKVCVCLRGKLCKWARQWRMQA